MSSRIAHTRTSAMWDGRCAPWLQAGADPGSVRTKAPPRVRRPFGAFSTGSRISWPPQMWAVVAVSRAR
jgi:hypothetical protein